MISSLKATIHIHQSDKLFQGTPGLRPLEHRAQPDSTLAEGEKENERAEYRADSEKTPPISEPGR
jgi:hypothetical protein